MTRTLWVGLVAVAIGGCGGGMHAPDVAAYQKLGADLFAAVQQYEARSSTLSAADCPAERDRYGAAMHPMLDRMASMSGDMDACMDEMGHAGMDDIRSTCLSMRSELDAYLAAACSTGDIAGEAARHATAMRGMVQHEMDRATIMQGMMGGGSMMSGGMCQR